MFELITFVVLTVIVSSISIIFIRLKNKNLELLMILDQTIEDIDILRQGFNGDALVEKEHLISFLTQTREDAFRYIEDIQKAVNEYIEEVEFDLENPSDLSVPRIKTALDKLKKIMPEDIPND
ncbi:MAG: hypothetical protein EB127_05010 [Alphaproteobacteria bacterium]|nr:hypothetical protein [Alphaproteobacteria bacterium]